MKISELRDGMSIKYEAEQRKDIKTQKIIQEAYTLVGMFMTLPAKAKDPSAINNQIPGTFIGYIKGSTQLKKLRVYLVPNDKAVSETQRGYFPEDILIVNISRLSATRMPKTVSDYLKQLHKKYQSEATIQAEISRLKQQSSQTNKEITDLSSNLSQSLVKDLKLDYKNLPSIELAKLAAEKLNTYKHRNEIRQISTDPYIQKPFIIVSLSFVELNDPQAMGLYRDFDGSISWNESLTQEDLFKIMNPSDKDTITIINRGLQSIKGIKYELDLVAEPSESFDVDVQGYYEIEIVDKENFEKIVKQLANVL
jgi:hypothetical protein